MDIQTTESKSEVLSVSQATRRIRNLVEDGLPPMWIEGEISNYTLHRSQHRYFTLKDAGAQISCVMWRTRNSPSFAMRDGQRVKVYGRVTVYEQGGKYQLDVHSIYPVGIGPLQEAFELLKRKLAEEGLFDLAHKKALPRFPKAIGIVTSQTGAAIRDLAWGFANRFPPADIYLIPVKVQGDGAAAEISAAIDQFNLFEKVDVIVVGRGGGSLEDLWAFNEEPVIRAVWRSRIPVVSAVGHEVDITLCDLVADLRAPTPTAASALVVPDRTELNSALRERFSIVTRILSKKLQRRREQLEFTARSYGLRRVGDRITEKRQVLDELSRNIEKAMVRNRTGWERNLDSVRLRIEALSPVSVLNRGYCVARRTDKSVVRNSADLLTNEKLNLRFFKGSAVTYVQEVLVDE